MPDTDLVAGVDGRCQSLDRCQMQPAGFHDLLCLLVEPSQMDLKRKIAHDRERDQNKSELDPEVIEDQKEHDRRAECDNVRGELSPRSGLLRIHCARCGVRTGVQIIQERMRGVVGTCHYDRRENDVGRYEDVSSSQSRFGRFEVLCCQVKEGAGDEYAHRV